MDFVLSSSHFNCRPQFSRPFRCLFSKEPGYRLRNSQTRLHVIEKQSKYFTPLNLHRRNNEIRSYRTECKQYNRYERHLLWVTAFYLQHLPRVIKICLERKYRLRNGMRNGFSKHRFVKITRTPSAFPSHRSLFQRSQ